MPSIEIAREENFRSLVVVERGCRTALGQWLVRSHPPPRKLALISDRNVASLHAESVEEGLRESGYDVKDFLIPPGEESKSFKMLGNLWDRLLAFGMGRDDLVVAIGGGVVGDLAGFTAATLQRGIDVVQVPTSLLAQVDAAIGGKTGINTATGKNLVGAFHHPILALIDPGFLETLPDRELRAGLAEVVKYGWIRDPSILTLLESHVSASALVSDHSVLDAIVERSVRIKAKVVEADPREMGERIHLNFGHTVGHALEAVTRFQTYLHGEAVAIGMGAASYLAVALGVAPSDQPAQIAALLERYELPTDTPVEPAQLLPALGIDKKRRRGRSRWVLCREPGRCEVAEEPDVDAILRALEAIHRTPSADEGEAEGA